MLLSLCSKVNLPNYYLVLFKETRQSQALGKKCFPTFINIFSILFSCSFYSFDVVLFVHHLASTSSEARHVVLCATTVRTGTFLLAHRTKFLFSLAGGQLG